MPGLVVRHDEPAGFGAPGRQLRIANRDMGGGPHAGHGEPTVHAPQRQAELGDHFDAADAGKLPQKRAHRVAL
jgi:hypothetical protein